MKAILVIDEMPKTCDQCPLRRWSIDGWTCTPVKKMIEDDKPEWCPLKLLPNKKEENDDGTHFSWRSNDWWSAGWNACLKEIEEWESY